MSEIFEKINKIAKPFQANLVNKHTHTHANINISININIRYTRRVMSQVQKRLKTYNNNVYKPIKINVKT